MLEMKRNRVLHKQKQILKQRLRHLLLAQIKKRPLPQITNKQKKQQLQKCQTTNTSSAKVSDKENGTENDDIGKGENFNGKEYLNYFGKQMTEILNGPTEDIKSKLIELLVTELAVNDYGVDKEIIKHLIAIYLLYDIAFAKNSVLMSMLGGTDDGTTPTENTGFYPNTKQLHQTVLNEQDIGKIIECICILCRSRFR